MVKALPCPDTRDMTDSCGGGGALFAKRDLLGGIRLRVRFTQGWVTLDSFWPDRRGTTFVKSTLRLSSGQPWVRHRRELRFARTCGRRVAPPALGNLVHHLPSAYPSTLLRAGALG